jgi:hypothetical protein
MNSTDITDVYENIEDQYLEISKKYLQIEESDLSKTLITLAATYAFFASVQSYAKKVKDLKALQLEGSEATVMERRREELVAQGVKPTQAALNSYILSVPDLINMRVAVLTAENKYNLSRNLVSALDHQQSMLIQISANKRAETKLHEL